MYGDDRHKKSICFYDFTLFSSLVVNLWMSVCMLLHWQHFVFKPMLFIYIYVYIENVGSIWICERNFPVSTRPVPLLLSLVRYISPLIWTIPPSMFTFRQLVLRNRRPNQNTFVPGYWLYKPKLTLIPPLDLQTVSLSWLHKFHNRVSFRSPVVFNRNTMIRIKAFHPSDCPIFARFGFRPGIQSRLGHAICNTRLFITDIVALIRMYQSVSSKAMPRSHA